jgi:hypothetical protein
VKLTYTLDDKEHNLKGGACFLKAAIDVARKSGAPLLDSQVQQ